MIHDERGNQVLAIDVGATNIKYAVVGREGRRVGSLRRRHTPHPCSPERLVDWLLARFLVLESGPIVVGFPGECRDGVVTAPGNLSRPHGVDSDIDVDTERAWRGYPLETVLRERSGRLVYVLNDASLAAVGCATGHGRELTVALGTGCGVALVVEGERHEVRDVGRAVVWSTRSFDDVVGEGARARAPEGWARDTVAVLDLLVREFAADHLHIAGGNARRLPASLYYDLSVPVTVHGNESPFRGAARLVFGHDKS